MDLRRHIQTIITLVIAVILIAAGQAGVAPHPAWVNGLDVSPSRWWHLVPLALIAIAMAFKFSRPILTLAVGTICVVLDSLIGGSIGIWLCLADLIYNVALRAPLPALRWTAYTLGVITVIAGAGVIAIGDGISNALGAMFILAVGLLMPLWWGSEVRRGYPLWPQDHERDRLAAERHASLLQLYDHQQQAAIEEERRRMARDLHDSVSSQVSAIALTAGAVLTTDAETARDRRALETIRADSVDALDQLQQMVMLLRGNDPTDDTASSPAPEETLAATNESTWDGVIQRAEAHGVDVHVEGSPPDDLSPAVGQVMGRALSEALTNVHKHGSGAATVSVTTTVQRAATLSGLLNRPLQRLHLHVDSPMAEARTNPEPLAAERDPAVGTGTGLLTLRERAELLGGSARAGPTIDDGQPVWSVHVELPYETTPTGGRP